MPDENQNGIPDSWDRPLGAVLTLAGIVFAGLAVHLDPAPWWLAFAAGLTTAIGGAFKIGIAAPRWSSTPALVLGLALAAAAGGAGCGYTLAAKITLGAREAGDAVAKGMAAQTRKVTADCLQKCKLTEAKATAAAAQAAAARPGAGGAAKASAAAAAKALELARACYAKCVAPWKVHRERFRLYAAPAISSTVAGGYMAIKLAKEAEKGGQAAIDLAMGVACAVALVLKPYLPLVGESWRAAAATGLGIAERLTCK